MLAPDTHDAKVTSLDTATDAMLCWCNLVTLPLAIGLETLYSAHRQAKQQPHRDIAGCAMPGPSVFLSYSHKDEAWKDRLVTHLGVLQREGLLDPWDDRRIGAGANWHEEIQQAIERASVAILLISADFLTSKFILEQEVPPLLERRQAEGLHIVPVILRPCAWKRVSWLSSIQSHPKDGRALSAGNNHQIEANLAAVADEAITLIENTRQVARPSAPATTPPVKSLLPGCHPRTLTCLAARQNWRG
jgi:hypothetical protein